jgi:hypothetical protein
MADIIGKCNQMVLTGDQIKHYANLSFIPFSQPKLSREWANMICEEDETVIEYVHLDIHNTIPAYTKEDLLLFIKAFHAMPKLYALVLDGWEEVCKRENCFERIRDELLDLIESRPTRFHLTFYMDKKNCKRYHFNKFLEKCVVFKIKNEQWD